MLLQSLFLAFVATSALAVPATSTERILVPVPRSDQVSSSLRQTTRRQIIERAELKQKRAARRAALGLNQRRQEQVSNPVYQTCSNLPSENAYARNSGFASITGYVIGRQTDRNIAGNLPDVPSSVVCAALCQNYEGCTGYEYNWVSGDCNFRKGSVPAARGWVTATSSYVMFIRGTCAEIAEYVNDNTIMSTCCDNRNTASTTCVSAYANYGAVCAAGRKTLSGNGPVQSANIAANDNTDLYAKCVALCRTRNSNAYTARTTNICTGVSVDVYKVRDETNNCFLYGNNPGNMEAVQNSVQALFVLGVCQQIKNGVPYTASVKDAAACDSVPVSQDI